MPNAVVTGSGGLIGSECSRLLCAESWEVIGLDNDMRREFFGHSASTRPETERLKEAWPNFEHHELDIRDRAAVSDLFESKRPDLIIHTAGQPSHDRAAAIPYDDFDVNAVGTLNLLVAARDYCPESPFCFTSTNKVYGDRPNSIPLVELDTRYEYEDGRTGVDESMSVDQCLHSLFGASKLSADILCQEFGRYFGMPVGIFPGRVSDRPSARGGGASRIPRIHYRMRDRKEALYGLRSQREAGAGPVALPRLGSLVPGVLPKANCGRGLQYRRRPAE